ncbi:arginase family protein [Cordyceps militaris CM01]|uniref:Arginase family protein n=1 Tax=Cordyceps militaris (strain CM01) TaxID=983644 RepID=G3JIA2_CORMM|nr:arginase family protein [Cordyceps militaris CM01]EGX91852.1 arginase family protein [Cordyceps militaris CM01]
MRHHSAAWALLAQTVMGFSAYDYNTPGAAQVRFWLNRDDVDDGAVTQMPFLTGTGFATLPVTDCFRDDDSEESRYDIAILGAPHDTTTTGRPGARFGPPAIRLGSNQKTYGLSVYTRRDALRDWATIVDCGDAKMTWLDNRYALKTLEQAHRKISGRPARSSNTSSVPRIITLGGDHTTTLAALRVTEKHWGPVSVIHFDSHIDTWDPSQLGGGISDYAQKLILDSSIHAGIRAQVVNQGDMRHDKDCGFHIITARDLDLIGVQGVIDRLRARVNNTRVYISIDIDVLDPAFAPATGTPETGGWSSRELLTILAGLEGLEIIGGDVVEVAPPYDNNAATTALAAAEAAFALLELMVATPVKVHLLSHLLGRRTKSGRPASLEILQWWADEYKSAVICGLSIAILSVVLWYYDGKLVPRLSPGLDLEMVVIALVTVARVAMGNVVEACLSQCAWIWIAKSHQRRTKTVARLEDFKLFDEASRGFLGSVALMWRMKGLHLSCIGAAIIIFTHGFETFSQQMVHYVARPIVFRNETERSAPANYRSEYWDNVEQRDESTSFTLQLSTKAAIYTGIIADEIPVLMPACSTGNCSWPIFPSLAVCGECTPKSVMTECNGQGCTYSVSPSTSVIVLHGDGNEAFRARPIKEHQSLKDQGNTAYLSVFEVVAASDFQSKTNSTAFECALWACMKAYDTSMNDGHLTQNVIALWNETQIEVETNAHLEEHVFVNVPKEMNTLQRSRHAISTRAVQTIRRFMDNLTDGWYEDNAGRVNFSSDWAEAIHDGVPAMSDWMEQLTLSLSNEFRRHGRMGDDHSTRYEGSATKLANFVKVKWLWMIYPPLCLTISIYYLFATILASVRDNVAVWKGDSMPMLFSCIHPDILQLGASKMDTHKGLDELGRHGIALEKAESGAWVFEPTVGPEDPRGRMQRVFRWRD